MAKKHKRYVKDAGLQFLQVPYGNVSKEHVEAVMLLHMLLVGAGYRSRCAHAEDTASSRDLPLWLDAGGGRRQHVEICFELRKGVLVFVDLLVLQVKEG